MNPQIPQSGWRLAALSLLLIPLSFFSFSCGEKVFSREMKGIDKGGSAPSTWAPLFVAPEHCDSADLSPDERLLAAHCVRADVPTGPEPRYLETIQLWDFGQKTMLKETELEGAGGGRGADGSSPRHGRVWFSSTGREMVVLAGTTVHILGTQGLKPVRTFRLTAPSSSVRSATKGILEFKPRLLSAEVSPATDRIAVLWNREYSYGKIDVYDLSTGNHFHSWEMPSAGNIHSTNGLAWSPDGAMLALAVPHESPKADILVLDVGSRELRTTIASSLVAASVAFISGDRILTVENRDRGLVFNRQPALHVFDIAKGTLVKTLSGRGGGVRYFVHSSGDGKRFLAYTGKSRPVFDYEGLSFVAAPIDHTITVWSSQTWEEIFTTPDIPQASIAKDIRLSRRGTYIMIGGDVYPIGDRPANIAPPR